VPGLRQPCRARRADRLCTGGLGCDAQLRRSIEYYAGDDGLDLEGIGEKSVRQLVDAGLLESVADLYELEREDLLALEGGARPAPKTS